MEWTSVAGQDYGPQLKNIHQMDQDGADGADKLVLTVQGPQGQQVQMVQMTVLQLPTYGQTVLIEPLVNTTQNDEPRMDQLKASSQWWQFASMWAQTTTTAC